MEFDEFERRDIEYFKREIQNICYLLYKAETIETEREELQRKIDIEMCGVKGVNYDKLPNSLKTTHTPYLNELILTEASYEAEVKRLRNKYLTRTKELNLTKRMQVLSSRELEIFERHFLDHIPLSAIANEYGNSRQWAQRKVDNLLYKMLKVEV